MVGGLKRLPFITLQTFEQRKQNLSPEITGVSCTERKIRGSLHLPGAGGGCRDRGIVGLERGCDGENPRCVVKGRPMVQPEVTDQRHFQLK